MKAAGKSPQKLQNAPSLPKTSILNRECGGRIRDRRRHNPQQAKSGTHQAESGTEPSQNTRNASKLKFSTGNRDFHPKHAECTKNLVFDRKSRFSPKTHRMHRKSTFRSETEIFTQNVQNAPKIHYSIGHRDFDPKHAECTENHVFDRKS